MSSVNNSNDFHALKFYYDQNVSCLVERMYRVIVRWFVSEFQKVKTMVQSQQLQYNDDDDDDSLKMDVEIAILVQWQKHLTNYIWTEDVLGQLVYECKKSTVYSSRNKLLSLSDSIIDQIFPIETCLTQTIMCYQKMILRSKQITEICIDDEREMEVQMVKRYYDTYSANNTDEDFMLEHKHDSEEHYSSNQIHRLSQQVIQRTNRNQFQEFLLIVLDQCVEAFVRQTPMYIEDASHVKKINIVQEIISQCVPRISNVLEESYSLKFLSNEKKSTNGNTVTATTDNSVNLLIDSVMKSNKTMDSLLTIQQQLLQQPPAYAIPTLDRQQRHNQEGENDPIEN